MRRTIYTEDHDNLRSAATSFFEREAIPHLEKWRQQGHVDKDLFQAAGDMGLLGFQVPEEFGGSAMDSFTYNAIVSEAAVAAGFMFIGLRLHSDIAIPYYVNVGSLEQQARWLPDLVSGRKIAALAMSEAQAGSDLAGIRTSAVRHGGGYLINGSKTFITNGLNADLVIVVARTSTEEDRRQGLTLFIVDADSPGFQRGRPLEKLGLPYSDTAELFFEDLEVPSDSVLGEEGGAIRLLTRNLAQERLSISVGAVAMAKRALEVTIDYVKGRSAFGAPLHSFQNTKFVLAGVAADIEAAQHLLDRGVADLDAGELTPADAAKVKLFCTEVQGRAVDHCLQLFGGYGYMREYPIADMYADARVTRIYGGSSEIMKVIIAKSLGL